MAAHNTHNTHCPGEFQEFYFGQNHPMKPHRLAMTHHLVLGYKLHQKMECYVSPGGQSELLAIHAGLVWALTECGVVTQAWCGHIPSVGWPQAWLGGPQGWCGGPQAAGMRS